MLDNKHFVIQAKELEVFCRKWEPPKTVKTYFSRSRQQIIQHIDLSWGGGPDNRKIRYLWWGRGDKQRQKMQLRTMAVIVVTERKVEVRNLRRYNEYGLENHKKKNLGHIPDL